MKTTYLGADKVPFWWENISNLQEAARKYNINIGDDCTIRSGSTIGYDCMIKSDCLSAFYLGRLYKYGVYIRIEKNKTFIKMGCHDRTIEEWDSDFYNNNKEFPRGSDQLKLREEAYTTAKTIAVKLRESLFSKKETT